MSLLNKASLIQIPSGYKDGTLYSAKPINGDGDFTFSRGSNLAATRVNSEGLIEKGRENVLLQSNTFDTTWTTTRLSGLTSGQSGYDGSSDAWSVIPNTANDDHKIYQSISQTGVVTFSVYAKANGYNGLALVSSNTNNGKFFNLSNGTLGNDFNSSPIDSTITEVSNGWYRCEVVFNVSAGNFFTIYVSSDGISTHSFSGNGTNGIYIQDAQLQQGLVATDYIETTTTTAQAGILEDMPRLDYSGGASCGSLLLEPQRTNLITQSEYLGASFWTKQQMTIASNSGIAPDGSLSATKVIPTTASATHQIQTGNIISSTQCAFSVFAKAGGYDTLVMLDRAVASNGATFYLSTQTAVTIGTATATIEDYGNDWYRCTIVANTTGMRIYIPNSSNAISGDGTSGVFIWGAQLEAGTYATSYIPTYGSSVTRSADSCSKTGISSLIGQTEGTLFVEVDLNHTSASNDYILQVAESSANRILLYKEGGTNKIGCYALIGSTTIYNQLTSGTFTGVNKIAFAYKSGDFAFYVNGTQIGTSTATFSTSATFDRVDIDANIGNENGYYSYNQTLLFPTRLTNDELADLTTL